MKILEDVPLAPYTTLGVGGAARWFAEAATEDDLLAAVQFARQRNLPIFLLGGGSNLLVSDHGFPGMVIHLASGETQMHLDLSQATIQAAAGADWDSIVRLAVDNNAAGIECLAGIPGSVGGTPVQNVGAYGQEVSHSIIRVRALDLHTSSFIDLAPADCGFAYRRSIFNTSARNRYAITRVDYALQLDAPPSLAYRDVKQYFAERDIAHPTLAETADAVRLIRARKGMLLAEDDPDSRSAGSFFKNPVVSIADVPRLAALANRQPGEVPQFPSGDPGAGTVKLSAAWLIELAGFYKGFVAGRAALSSKHVLAIVNRGGASASDIIALRDLIIARVHIRTGIRLEQEPVLLGFPPALG